MPNWSGGILTTKGQALQAKVDAGQTTLTLTKMKIGSGVLPNGQNLLSLNDLVVPEMNVPISAVSANANISTIIGVITNAGLARGFNVRELGVYAQDPTLGEILYAITTDSAPDYLPAEGGAVTVSSEFSYNIVVSNAANVTATIDPNGLVTVSILQLHKNAAVLDHPDGSVTDAKIGNRTITDTTALASTAGTLTTLLGRIGNMIKGITGKANWYTAPAVNLEKINTRLFWRASTAYIVGDICLSTVGSSYKIFECTTAGTSGTTEPGWGAAESTIADGTATWTIRNIRNADTVDGKHATDFAPGNYGLGGYATAVTDANLAVLSGFYYIPGYSSGGLNIPVETAGASAYILVEAIDGSNVKQTLFNRANSRTYTRNKMTNTWTAWVKVTTDESLATFGIGSTSPTKLLNSIGAASGFYYSAASDPNSPNTLDGQYLEITIDTNNAFQQWFSYGAFTGTGTGIYERRKFQGSWTAWRQVATSDLTYMSKGNVPADWNTATEIGCYTVGTTTGLTNDAISALGLYSYGQLQVSTASGGGTAIQQTYYAHTGNHIAVRLKYNSSWTPWKQVPTTDIVTTKVGNPTGRDFNNFTMPDTYVHVDTGATTDWYNTPIGTIAAGTTKCFTIRNIGLSNVRMLQYCHFYYPANVAETWVRSLVGTTWSAWKKITTEEIAFNDKSYAPANWNTIIIPGVYLVVDGNPTGQTNTAPLALGIYKYGQLVVTMAGSNTSIQQTYYAHTGAVAIRHSFDGGTTWQPWLQIATTDIAAKVAVLTGTIADGGTIPLPSGYTQAQCQWTVSANHIYNSQESSYTDCRADANRVVYIKNTVQTTGAVANYVIIGVK